MILLLVVAAMTANAGAAICRGTPYERALCLYTAGEFATAEKEFLAMAASDEKNPEVLKSRYFAARCEMRQKKWADAQKQLIAIFSLDPSFYREWSCD